MRRYFLVLLAALFIGSTLSGCTFGKNDSAENVAVQSFPSRDRGLVKKAFMKKYQVPLQEVHVSFLKQTPDYIRGEASIGSQEDAVKKVFLAARKGAEWEIAADNGVLSCAALESYQFPAEMMADCTK